MSEPETAAKVEASVHDARRHTLERTIMFTDAAVAIALTIGFYALALVFGFAYLGLGALHFLQRVVPTRHLPRFLRPAA